MKEGTKKITKELDDGIELEAKTTFSGGKYWHCGYVHYKKKDFNIKVQDYIYDLDWIFCHGGVTFYNENKTTATIF